MEREEGEARLERHISELKRSTVDTQAFDGAIADVNSKHEKAIAKAQSERTALERKQADAGAKIGEIMRRLKSVETTTGRNHKWIEGKMICDAGKKYSMMMERRKHKGSSPRSS